VGYFEQSKELTELRREDQAIRALPVVLAREPLRRVHRAFQAFFRRVRAGQRAGYPRFRSGDRYNSFSLSAPAFRMEGPNVLIAKLGGFRHGTSQICSNCGAMVPKGIEERRHECNQCGLSMSRDHNAALNILALGRSAVGLAPPEVRI
jgi:transposase